MAARGHIRPRGRAAGRGPTMGSRAPVSCKSEVRPARPAQPLHPRPPPNVCTSIKAAGRTLSSRRRSGEVGGAGSRSSPRPARLRGVAGPPTTLPNSLLALQAHPDPAGVHGLRPPRASSAHRPAYGSPACGARVVPASLLRRRSPAPDSVRPRHAPRPAALPVAPRTPAPADQPTRHPGPRGPHLGRGSPALRVRPWVGPAPREEKRTEINKTTPSGSFFAPLIKRRTSPTHSARAWRGTPRFS